MKYPVSPSEMIEGMVYFVRLCDKIRLYEAGQLPQDYHANLGLGMDLWTCQLLEVEYEQLAAEVRSGKSDEEVLQWAYSAGKKPESLQLEWWNSYMRNRGLRDNLSERLKSRIEEDGMQDRHILTFFDYIDADEGR